MGDIEKEKKYVGPFELDYAYNKKKVAVYVSKEFIKESGAIVEWMKPKMKRMDARYYGILRDGKSGWMIPKLFKDRVTAFIHETVATVIPINANNEKEEDLPVRRDGGNEDEGNTENKNENDKPIPTIPVVVGIQLNDEGTEEDDDDEAEVEEVVPRRKKIYHREKSEIDEDDDYQDLVGNREEETTTIVTGGGRHEEEDDDDARRIINFYLRFRSQVEDSNDEF